MSFYYKIYIEKVYIEEKQKGIFEANQVVKEANMNL